MERPRQPFWRLSGAFDVMGSIFIGAFFRQCVLGGGTKTHAGAIVLDKAIKCPLPPENCGMGHKHPHNIHTTLF